jgi:hypothetical protein
MNSGEKTPRTIANITGAVLSDFAAVLGIPSSTVSQVFRNWLNRKAAEARDILLEELAADRTSDLNVASEDDLIGVVYRYGLAVRDGTARVNLRLLAKTITGLGRRDRIFADEFNKYAEILARLSRDEILVIGTLHRYRKAEERRQGPNVSTHQFWTKFIKEIVPSQFPSDEHVIAVCCAALKSGLVITPRDFDSTGEFSTSPIMDEVAELADFKAALDAEPGL